jgi:DNA-binding transcriptional ArsR family regulator
MATNRLRHPPESESGAASPGRSESERPSTPSLAADDLLGLLDDDFARHILQATTAEAKPARALVRETNASRATVYRRLRRLEEAGLVATGLSIDDDGHHRTTYRACLDRATVELDDDGFTARVSRDPKGASVPDRDG